MHPSLEPLLRRYRDIRALDSAQSLMSWDMQVLMPPAGATARNAHLSILSRLEHDLWTAQETGRELEAAESQTQPDSDEGALLRAFRRDYDVQSKLPAELVERKSRVSGEAYQAWKIARAASDFASMRPFYEELVEIAREASHLLDPDAAHPYDPLHDLYEEGATTAQTTAMFEAIKAPTVTLVKAITERGSPVEDGFLYGDWNQEDLRNAAERITAAVGFDYNRGRLNLAPNAFCTHMANSDVRMTTKPSEHVKGILSSSLHEMGHGLYEQHSPNAWEGTPLAGGISLAVHESQSRMWENLIGRSREFWSHFLPDLQSSLPSLLGVSLEEFYRAMNKVQAGFIRVGADELTYNLHILVRFELETDLISRKLEVRDLPEAWNAKYEAYLGLRPSSDGVGVLQDVHWSRGSFGYFPTYSMGNLVSGQVWTALQRDIPNTAQLISDGRFSEILGWLSEKIYSQARRYHPSALVERVTGRKMDPADWLRYAEGKYGEIYGLA